MVTATQERKKINITPRGALVAPPGYVIASIDWSAQEAMISAYYSGSEKMLDIFRQPIYLEDGKTKNPLADIHCYSEDTEILTTQGWKTFDQLSRDDLVAQFSPKDDSISWTTPKEVVWEPYSGDMIRFSNKSLDLLVTPNHRMLVKSAKYNASKCLYASEVSSTNGDYRVPTSGNMLSHITENENILRLVIATQADGSFIYSKNGDITSIRFSFFKDRKCERLKSILESLECRYNERLENRGDITFVVLDKELISKVVSYLTPYKDLNERVINLDHASRKTLIEEVRYWDGTTRKNGDCVLDTISEKTVDVLQTLCHISNYRCHRTSYSKKADKECTIHRLYIGQNRPWASLVNSKSSQHYEGYVGCVSVETGYVVVRRNGKVAISGNTINAKNCTHPWLFEGVPIEKQVEVAKDPTLITEKNSARHWAKSLLYGISYLQGAKGLADHHNIPVERAKKWIEQHQETFPHYHRWVAQEKHLAEVRGWARTPGSYIRFVREDNAKAAGASPGRSGVNHKIQSFGAEMAKRSLVNIFNHPELDHIRLVNAVHDEIVVMIPGKASLDLENSKIENNIITAPKFNISKEAEETANEVADIMKTTEEEMFDGLMKGRVEVDLAPYWAH
jgi:hypothetical protein